MDTSPVLRLQSQNKIRSDFMRMKNETNKMPSHPKPSKLQSAPHLSDQNIENQDPGNSQAGRKAPVRPGVSRLPVLAKSLRLQTPSDFSQSHCQWEDKPLSGKAKKKRPNTRPIPFNLSQPKSSRVASENQHPLTLSQTKTGTHAVKPNNSACNIHLKPQTSNAKSTKHPATLNSHSDSSKGTAKSNGKATDHTSHLSVQAVPSTTLKTSTTLSQPLSAVSNKALHQSHGTTSAQSAHNAEACLDNMSLLSLKDPIKSASQNMQLTTQGNFTNSSNEKGEIFQPDHAAFLSILRNEGVSMTGSGSTTPQSKAYNYVPQRVSVMRSRQKAGPSTGLVRSMQFSPDPAALQSILQNEGVRAGGPVGATPFNPARPSGRGTSVYTAQRVPVRRNHVEGGPVVALKETPLKKWTPQRVRDTRHQPMSAVKWLLSTQQSPYGGTPGLRSCKTNLQPQQEEIVQRLFSDQEDQQGMKDPDTGANQLPAQITSDLESKPHCEEKEETSRATKDNNDDQEENGQEQRNVGGQPSLQAPHRESVIFFSTGKQLLRVPRFEKLESSANQQQHGVISSAQKKMLPVHEEKSSISEPTNQIIPPIQSLHRDLTVQKTCSKSPAVAMLRKRLPQLEELRLDEEVATYTSVSVQTAPGFLPPRPRCGNPLASILHFEEYSRFVPIDRGLSPGPSSPLQEK
ncbi:protein Daple [Cheilinus undulatus]|uniref:protein Daple n=1 Tax=Cheilinus undulatus TaxID=241271 RepID=UPI001BD2CC95|nr:protein Daple [Cheilinus undulatus]XP_041654543.1 protein Daple [Cheilinus undulatus]XP_041654544.1 protein Daple [Cheilinus undulatus]XP_041654545.1 protein Daple [Cheilinus undulatus]